MTEPTVLSSLRLTGFQRQECEHGLGVDDTDGTEPWGAVRYTGKTSAWLDVYDVDDALYRVTSSRDIFLDNAAAGMVAPREALRFRSQARSLQLLTDKLVEAAGGVDALSATIRHWL